MNEQTQEKAAWGKALFAVTSPDGRADTVITVTGRTRWALQCLIAAGESGCTPIDYPGPRWSAYVFDLRALGVAIETVSENHDGPFQGTHARYVLRCAVRRVETIAEAVK